jgi:hypothetical protein
MHSKGFQHHLSCPQNLKRREEDNGPANDRSWTSIYERNGIGKKFAADCPQEMDGLRLIIVRLITGCLTWVIRCIFTKVEQFLYF